MINLEKLLQIYCKVGTEQVVEKTNYIYLYHPFLKMNMVQTKHIQLVKLALWVSQHHRNLPIFWQGPQPASEETQGDDEACGQWRQRCHPTPS